MSGKLNVGIAGYGIVGRRRREVIDARSDMHTVAVCDQTMDGEGVYEDGVRHYTTFERLLEAEPDLDILFVCLSNDVNPAATIGGLEHGLHVFCEKPPGRDVADIVRVMDVEKKYPDLRLQYGFNHRYHDSVRDALTLVQSGELGRVINLRGVYGKSQLITFNQTSWRTQRDLAGGGVLLDQGIHMVDLLRLFAGEFTDIHSFVDNGYWGHDVEDNAYALMRTDDGIVAMVHSSATQWRHRFNLEITLQKGSVTLSGILSGSKSYGTETLTVARVGDDDRGDPREETIRYNRDPSWTDEVAEFAAAITEKRPVANGSSHDALKTMELVYGIYCADPEWKARWELSSQ
ncbi:Gfo/Idh/MocA family protein [Magnetospira sp. QH-2]|uniref:Gfo/Idh/MocA family protein n=1 Tax=Magnetospira sp. (strain QH-2) TaxID=1288970 RepID=UPI0003E81788|nr:Gfo/Idh/MocA family oxidoreductase [Magnetospira sp. QH-2]CCQ75480.1 putative Oxidoreductase family protein [Magnetospira sp. QH-2]